LSRSCPLWVKSDHFGVLADVRYYPQSDRNSDMPDGRCVPLATKVQCSKSGLFDHLVGAGKQRRRHGEAERLSGLDVDHQLILGWTLHRHVGRFLAL